MASEYAKACKEIYENGLKFKNELKKKGIYVISEDEKIEKVPKNYDIYLKKDKSGKLRILKQSPEMPGIYISKKDADHIYRLIEEAKKSTEKKSKLSKFLKVATLAGLLALTVPLAFKKSEMETYTVRAGDSYWKIAAAQLEKEGIKNPPYALINNVALEIAKVNNEDLGLWGKTKEGGYWSPEQAKLKNPTDPSLLRPGEKLKIPPIKPLVKKLAKK